MLWTFNKILGRRVELTPDKEAIVYNDVGYTWKEIDVLTDHAAQYFVNRNVKKGCNVGIWAPNSIQWIVAFAGLAKIGAIPVLINTHYTVNELKRTVIYADIKLMCYSSNTGGGAPDCGSDVIDLADEFLELVQSVEITPELDRLKQDVKPDDTFTMLFTSGTTSFAKGVMLSHNGMLKVAEDASAIMHWGEDDTNCMALPLFHCFGLSTGLLSAIACGSRMIICKGTRSQQILDTILKYDCTILNGVPTMFFALARNLSTNPQKITTLRSGFIAGAAISYEDYKSLCEAIGMDKLQMSYGQTESSPSITFSDYDDDPELKAKSVGVAIPDIELAIFDFETGKRLTTGEVGEIRIRGYNVMKGYYKMPEETAKTIDSEGWLHTGDLGCLDEAGNLYFRGRIKELIIRGGENISPREIESYIREYKGVETVKVIGIPAAIVQEKIVACIIPKDGVTIDTEDLDSYLRHNLAKYKIPEEYVYLSNFPMNASGKISLNDLKEVVINKLQD
ncbi:MAG: acyl--CoA ligase [Lachnospiraceae bacterium]|jgi:fatty-acyl-CoA synthase|nr:acyl--CoA ligase [Lachnospiraceae bacterium]